MKKIQQLFSVLIVIGAFFSCRSKPEAETVPEKPVKKTVISDILGDPNDQKGRFVRKVFNSKSGTLPYQIFIPPETEEGKKYPLLVFLHGAGEMGDNNIMQTNNFPRDLLIDENAVKYPCYAVAPQCTSDNRWIEFLNFEVPKTSRNPTASMSAVLRIIQELTS